MDHAVYLILLTLIGIGTLVLISLGLAVIFGLMGVINLAHGEFLMLGAVLTVVVHERIPLVPAMVVAALAVGVFGAVVEVLLIKRLAGRMEYTLLSTFGLSLIMIQAIALTYGTSPRTIHTPLGTVGIGDFSLSTYQLLLVPVAALLVAATYLVLTRTNYGLMSRAAIANGPTAACCGVNVSRINTITFALGATLTGAAGAVLAPLVAVVPTLGVDYVARAFMTVVVGGAGVITGTAAAAGVLGTVQTLVSDVTNAILGAGALLLTSIVLLRFMPAGISGRMGREM